MTFENVKKSRSRRALLLRFFGLLAAIFLIFTLCSIGHPTNGDADPIVDVRASVLHLAESAGWYESPTVFWGGMPALPSGGTSASMSNEDGSTYFNLRRDRQPVYRPFWHRVGERVKVTLTGSMVDKITAIRLVDRTGIHIHEEKVTPGSSSVSVAGYVADKRGGYEIHVFERMPQTWRQAWSWSWGK